MKFFRNNPEAVAERTQERDEPKSPRQSTVIPPPESPARPDVYPGNMPLGHSIDFPSPAYPGSRNRRLIRRRTSPFSIILILLGAAIAIVLYISNIIAVNQLLNDINALQAQYDRITMEQEVLRAQINKMASLERIQEKAQQELNLKNPSESPIWLQIDQEKVKNIKETQKNP